MLASPARCSPCPGWPGRACWSPRPGSRACPCARPTTRPAGVLFSAGWESRAGYKLLVHEETGAILGAHLLGFQSEEAVNLFGMAIRAGLGVEDMRSMLWAYPSRGYRMRHMLDAL